MILYSIYMARDSETAFQTNDYIYDPLMQFELIRNNESEALKIIAHTVCDKVDIEFR